MDMMNYCSLCSNLNEKLFEIFQEAFCVCKLDHFLRCDPDITCILNNSDFDKVVTSCNSVYKFLQFFSKLELLYLSYPQDFFLSTFVESFYFWHERKFKVPPEISLLLKELKFLLPGSCSEKKGLLEIFFNASDSDFSFEKFHAWHS